MSENEGQETTLYALSTCGWCKMTKGWLDDNNVKYDCIYVDHLSKDERETLISELTERLGRRPAFPTVCRGDQFVIGFNKEQLDGVVRAVIDPARIDKLYERLDGEAEGSGYHLNRDVEFTKSLVEGLLMNEDRYGYWVCPCRLAEGDKEVDLDIICPCDYRDPDLEEYGACYCALYVSQSILDGDEKLKPVPERRPDIPPQLAKKEDKTAAVVGEGGLPIWRCRVCGYLCARDSAPGVCPICKAKKDRFERFGFGKAVD